MKRRTQDEFILELKEANPNITALGKYKSNKAQIEVKCNKCRNVWFARPVELLKGSQCKKCLVDARRKTQSDFLYELNIQNSNIEVLSEYENYHTKVKCKCKVDGHIWFAVPANLLKGHGCPKCSRKYNRTHDEFVEDLEKISPTIEVLSEFKNVSTKVKCKCKVDGHIWYALPNSLLKGTGCKVCNESKGEKAIKAHLNNNNITFEWQKTFDGLVGIGNRPLSYDFYIKEYNLLIEYQGEFHDGTVVYQTQKEFETQVKHDERKRRYAKLHKMDLLEIWYYDFDNIEKIISNVIEKYKNKL